MTIWKLKGQLTNLQKKKMAKVIIIIAKNKNKVLKTKKSQIKFFNYLIHEPYRDCVLKQVLLNRIRNRNLLQNTMVDIESIYLLVLNIFNNF